MNPIFGPRRAEWIRIAEPSPGLVEESDLGHFAFLDLVYRALCSVLYNFAQSGHPGGSISSGRIVAGLCYDAMDYDVANPDRLDADVLSYAAGHKALGLYAMLALRDEIVRIGAPGVLPREDGKRVRLEDLLGFRRNPTHQGHLFRRFGAKALDGHPTPATPFVRLATGASGVGVGASLGLAAGLADLYGRAAPRVHVIEGEGGLTPGRVAEALAFAGTAGLWNAVLHVDWNQSSIDSDAVTREGGRPGDYVQWDPMELLYLHDWNVVEVPDGLDFALVLSAQRRALEIDNGQPTAIVYRTEKGWRYGIEGRVSHGAGHKLCSPGYRHTLESLLGPGAPGLPRCVDAPCRQPGCDGELEGCYWETLCLVREVLLATRPACDEIAARVVAAQGRLDGRGRTVRADAPDVERLYAAADPARTPEPLALRPGASVALREQLGRALGHLNRASRGALLVGAADLLDSTAISAATEGFAPGFFHLAKNPASRTIAAGGICEDGLACVLSGVAATGRHAGVGASYGAFLAPLGHVAARLHAIGNQMRTGRTGGASRPLVLVCGHAGLKTGEDGPTHADPQALQLVQENFPEGAAIALTPWEPSETWPLVAAAFAARPALVFPFVTRPRETVPDREALGLAAAEAAADGVYVLRPARGPAPVATVVLQGSEVAYAFVDRALPALDEAGLDVEALYVASAELFDRRPAAERASLFAGRPVERRMGITGFTRPTMDRWVPTDVGREHTLHPFRKRRYLGSGPGPRVLAEAGLDGEAQVEAIRAFVDALVRRRAVPAGA